MSITCFLINGAILFYFKNIFQPFWSWNLHCSDDVRPRVSRVFDSPPSYTLIFWAVYLLKKETKHKINEVSDRFDVSTGIVMMSLVLAVAMFLLNNWSVKKTKEINERCSSQRWRAGQHANTFSSAATVKMSVSKRVLILIRLLLD